MNSQHDLAVISVSLCYHFCLCRLRIKQNPLNTFCVDMKPPASSSITGSENTMKVQMWLLEHKKSTFSSIFIPRKSSKKELILCILVTYLYLKSYFNYFFSGK